MALEIINLNKKFGEKTLFRDFSFLFQNSGCYILSGESGIGKTTLLRMIAGLDTDFSGKIIGGGIEKTSYCFQEHRLFPALSALDNIIKVSFDAPSDELKDNAIKLLNYLGFSSDDMKLKPSKLSGGMKQRVAFVRSVLRNKPILLLDEPTKELDTDLSDKVLGLIKEESRKRLVLIVTHRKEEWDILGGEIIKI